MPRGGSFTGNRNIYLSSAIPNARIEYLVDETCGDYPPLYKNWIAYDGRPISLFVSATIFAKTVLQDQSELPIEKEKYDIHWVSGLPSSTSSPPTNDSVAESSVTFTKTTSDSPMSTNIGSEVFESTTNSKLQPVNRRFRQLLYQQIRTPYPNLKQQPTLP